MASGLLLAPTALAAAPGPELWTSVTSPNTNATVSNSLSGVSCVSSADCWAVGRAGAAGGVQQTLMEQNTGSGWVIVAGPSLPTRATSGELTGVTCLSSGDCWAVGWYTAGGVSQTLTEQDTGSGWAVVSSPDTSSGQNNYLEGVACASASDCVAVGSWAAHTLIEQNTGSGWAIVSSPDSSVGDLLNAVTCPNTSNCLAVGFSYAGIADQTLVEQNTGSGWAIVTSPNTPGGDNDLLGVTCVGASDCWAVGDVYNGSAFQTLVLQNAGSGWSLVSSPNNGVNNSLSGVTCESSSDCWAVGQSATGTDVQALIEQNTGSGWSVVASADSGQSDILAAVSCPAAGDCLAVGLYGNGSVPFTRPFQPPPSGLTATLIEQTYQPTGDAYTPLTPFRICDTRQGTGTECSGSSGDDLLGQGQTMTFLVSSVTVGGESVPSGAQSVVLNVTAISGTAGTFLTVFPAGSLVPTASSLNPPAQTNQANLVVVAVGSGGQVSIYNSLGSINVAVDVEGYFAAPSGSSSIPGLFHPIPPLRICDTRAATGTECSGTSTDNLLGQGQWTKVVVSGCPTGNPSCTSSIPTADAAAVALNLTSVSGTSFTYLAVVPPSGGDACPTGIPAFSNLNVGAQTNLPNRVIVPLGPNQDVCVYNSLGSINFILDVNGWFGTGSESSSGAFFYSVNPLRICDTRNAASVGYTTECSGSTLTQGGTLTVPIAGVDGLGASGGHPVAVIANVTAVSGTSFTYFTLYPADVSRPNASDLNVGANQNTPNLVIVQLATTGSNAGAVDLFNDLGSINAIVDVAGWFQ
jgi:hypothetical protein